MATKEEFEQSFERVPAAGLRIGKTSQDVYKMLQRGELSGIIQGGKWWVARKSVDRYLAPMQKDETADATA